LKQPLPPPQPPQQQEQQPPPQQQTEQKETDEGDLLYQVLLKFQPQICDETIAAASTANAPTRTAAASTAANSAKRDRRKGSLI